MHPPFHYLQSLNPLPYVAMWANCVAWLVYSFLTTDPYVLASNIPGVLIATWLTLSCYGFAEERVSGIWETHTARHMGWCFGWRCYTASGRGVCIVAGDWHSNATSRSDMPQINGWMFGCHVLHPSTTSFLTGPCCPAFRFSGCTSPAH